MHARSMTAHGRLCCCQAASEAINKGLAYGDDKGPSATGTHHRQRVFIRESTPASISTGRFRSPTNDARSRWNGEFTTAPRTGPFTIWLALSPGSRVQWDLECQCDVGRNVRYIESFPILCPSRGATQSVARGTKECWCLDKAPGRHRWKRFTRSQERSSVAMTRHLAFGSDYCWALVIRVGPISAGGPAVAQQSVACESGAARTRRRS